jgi:DNA processing protein
MAGIATATLVIEAGERSGTLITARMATDYNRELLVVPGNIFSANSAGPHQFLKLGATPIVHPDDILSVFGIDPTHKEKRTKQETLSVEEVRVLSHLTEPTSKDSLIRKLDLETHNANTLLMQMEIKGLIANENDQYRML